MKKREYITLCLLILLQSVCLSQEKQLRYIAGYPNYNLTPNQTNDDWNVVYTSAILKKQGDSLIETKILCDSMHMLYYLRYYPSQNTVSAVLVGKTQKYYNFSSGSYRLLTIDARTEDTVSVAIPSKIDTLGDTYKLFDQKIYALNIGKDIKYGIFYDNFKIEDLNTKKKSNVFYYILDPHNGRLQRSTSACYQYVLNSGSAVGPYMDYNKDSMPLQADTVHNLLRIPSELDIDSVYKTSLPSGTKLFNYWAVVVINDAALRVLNLLDYSSSSITLHLYLKNQNIWRKIVLPSSGLDNLVIMKHFNGWLAGALKVKNERGALMLKKNQLGQEVWSKSRTKYSPSIYEILEAHEPLWYSEGILYIYNVYTETYIQWDTKQADSEILLVENGKVYYRKYDEIYEVPIVKGKSLGKHRLVVKNKYVPAIHFMFMTKGSK